MPPTTASSDERVGKKMCLCSPSNSHSNFTSGTIEWIRCDCDCDCDCIAVTVTVHAETHQSTTIAVTASDSAQQSFCATTE